MPVFIQIPTALRALTDKQSEVAAEGATVGAAVESLAASYPDIKKHLYDENGVLRSFVNIYFGDTNIKNLDGLDTPLKDGDKIMLVPAIAGGDGTWV
ncbi:MoaD family protein [Synergistales bacterium]|nr:MoaD family protein [Synergistales bacterium]